MIKIKEFGSVVSVMAVFGYFLAMQEEVLSMDPAMAAELAKRVAARQGQQQAQTPQTQNRRDHITPTRTTSHVITPSSSTSTQHSSSIPTPPSLVSTPSSSIDVPAEITSLAEAYYKSEKENLDLRKSLESILETKTEKIDGEELERKIVKSEFRATLTETLCQLIERVIKSVKGYNGEDLTPINMRLGSEVIVPILRAYKLPERRVVLLSDAEVISGISERMLQFAANAPSAKELDTVRFFRSNRIKGTLTDYQNMLQAAIPQVLQHIREQIEAIHTEQPILTDQLTKDRARQQELGRRMDIRKHPDILAAPDAQTRSAVRAKILGAIDKEKEVVVSRIAENSQKLDTGAALLSTLTKIDEKYLRTLFLDKSKDHYTEITTKKTKPVAITAANSLMAESAFTVQELPSLKKMDKVFQAFLRRLFETEAASDGSVELKTKPMKPIPSHASPKDQEKIEDENKQISEENEAIFIVKNSINFLKKKHSLEAIANLEDFQTSDDIYALFNKEAAIQAVLDLSEEIAKTEGKMRKGKSGRNVAIDYLANLILKSRPSTYSKGIDELLGMNYGKTELGDWKLEYMSLLGSLKEKDIANVHKGMLRLREHLSSKSKTIKADFNYRTKKIMEQLNALATTNALAKKIVSLTENFSERYLAAIGLPQEPIIQVLDTIGDGDCAFRAMAPEGIWNGKMGATRTWAADLLLQPQNIGNAEIRRHIGAEIAYRRAHNQLPQAVSDALSAAGNDTTAVAVVRSYIENFVRPTVLQYQGREANYLEFPSPAMNTSVATALALILHVNLIVIDASDGTVLYGAAQRNPALPDLIVAQDGINHVCRTRVI